MKAILTAILIVSLSIMAIAGKNKAKTYQCPECDGSKRIQYGTFMQKCKTCKGVGIATLKQIYKSEAVNFYLYKKDFKGRFTPMKIRSGKYATKKVTYDKRTKTLIITKTSDQKPEYRKNKSATNKRGDGFKRYRNSKKSFFSNY